MANLDAPFGLRPVNNIGQANCGRITTYYAPASYATDLFVGDAVVTVGDSNDNEVRGKYMPQTLQEVNLASVNTGATTGVIVGFESLTRESAVYGAASTERVIFVADDPYQKFEIQADGIVTADMIGLNASLIYTNSGSTVYGLSGAEMDTGTTNAPATTAGLQLKIHGLAHSIDNDAAAANSKVIVSLNTHTLAHGEAGVS